MLKRAYSLLISDKTTTKQDQTEVSDNVAKNEDNLLKRRKIGYGYQEGRGLFSLTSVEEKQEDKKGIRSHRYGFPKETDFPQLFGKDHGIFYATKGLTKSSLITSKNGSGLRGNFPHYPKEDEEEGTEEMGSGIQCLKGKRLSTPAQQKLRCEQASHTSSYLHSTASTTLPLSSWDSSSNCASFLHHDTNLVDSANLTCKRTPCQQVCQWDDKPNNPEENVIWALRESSWKTKNNWVESKVNGSCSTVQESKRRGSSGIRVSAFRIDGGYIITPGNHRVLINQYIMDAKNDAFRVNQATIRPAAAALASYAHDMYIKWRLLEEQIDKRTFQLSFRPRSDLERFRQMALQCIFHYATTSSLCFSTLHSSVHNVHRVLLHYVKQKKVRLTASMFFGTLAACLRMALKHEETPEVLRPFREASDNIWRRLGLEDHSLSHVNTAYVNTVEVDCLMILKDPLTPPSAPDYLDRYLTVGGWPARVTPTYRELALFLTSLALFSRMEIDQLAGIPPSRIAACALSLAVKVISAGSDDGYEFWPQRLSVYSGYSIDDLRIGIRGLSALLRKKPPGSDVLHCFHPVWGRYSWK